MKDGQHARGLAASQIFEIDIRDQGAGQIAMALESENLVFKIHQAATLEAQLPETARAMEQVEMLETGKGRARPVHAITRLEQWLIEGPDVVSNHHAKGCKMPSHGV